jgi:LPS-assembly protein
LLYLPFLEHNINDSGRESGFLFDGFEDSTVKGLVFGEQLYWAINRSNDLTVGAQYWSQRGFAPNGAYRYQRPKCRQPDRPLERPARPRRQATVTNTDGTTSTELLNQGGADISAVGRKDFTENARISGASSIFPATSTASPSMKTWPRPPAPRCSAT